MSRECTIRGRGEGNLAAGTSSSQATGGYSVEGRRSGEKRIEISRNSVEKMSFLFVFGDILDLKFFGLWGKLLVFFCHALRAATNVRARQKDNKLFWLHSFVLVLLTGFGGGILTPLFLGQPSKMLASNLIVPLSGLAWYLTHYVDGFQELCTWIPVKLVWGFGHCLFRVFTICNMVTLANSKLSADPYYPIPLVGPIVAGIMTATLGMFQPFDKGLTAIKESMPWPLQCAVVNATVFHLLINDTEGALGFYLRRATGFTYFGFESLSENEKNIVVRGVLLVMWVTYQFGQTIVGPNFNIFQPAQHLLKVVEAHHIAPALNQSTSEATSPKDSEDAPDKKVISKQNLGSPAATTIDKRHNTRSRTKKKTL